MDTKKRRWVGDWLERCGTFVAVAAIVAGFGWYQANRAPVFSVARCREEYSIARSASDTALVDGQVVGRRPGWTCGELRHEGAIAPVQHIVSNRPNRS